MYCIFIKNRLDLKVESYNIIYMSKTSGITIGIDLGTTNSCVAYYNDNGEVQIITNDQGGRTTPSYVTYTDTQRLVGEASRAMTVEDIKNTIFDVKRLIGRKFQDVSTQEDLKTLPYDIVNRNGQCAVRVNYMDKEHVFLPEEVSSVILTYLKTQAENVLGEPVANAVITVPAYFNDAQRQATKDAGALAGLNVLRIINEPTAACMCYGLQKVSNDKNILVFDLGGGTFDVSLLNISSEDGVFQVLATAGDTHLGGEDFDNTIAHHLANEYFKKTGKDVRKDQRALRQIKIAAEQAKRTLSSATKATVNLSHIGPNTFTYDLRRAKFNDLCAPTFKKIMEPINKVLKDAGVNREAVDEIVLVGGSSRIPKIQSMLQDYFSGKKLNQSINPDEAVAYGAAVNGALLSKTDTNLDILLVDVAPLSLGVETQGGRMDVVIPRQKTIPCTEKKTYHTAKDNQTSVLIQVYEGERAMTKDNNKLGEFELSGIPPKPRHTAEVEVTFTLDTDGILSVSAVETSTGAARNIVITNNKGRLSDEELEAKIQEALKYKEQDEEAKARAKEYNESEEYLYAVRESRDTVRGLTAEDKKELESICNAGFQWLEDNNSSTSSEIQTERRQWEKKVTVIYNKANASAGQYNAYDDKGSENKDDGSGSDEPHVEDVEDDA